jgi:leader peptidase (prepilin peptidase)/N-methyltransferase
VIGEDAGFKEVRQEAIKKQILNYSDFQFDYGYYGFIFKTSVLKKEGLGFGDVKYAAAAGLLLGWQKLIPAILVASVVGAVCMITANRIHHANKHTEYPFGPFLALGTLLTIFFGNAAICWYIGLFSI